MTYQITISKLGDVVDTVLVNAPCALDAIKTVEKQFKVRDVGLSQKNGQYTVYQWTGCEFEARKVG